MMDQYSDDLVVLQAHTSYYATSWGVARRNYFKVLQPSHTGIPTTWFDSRLECYGAYTNDNQMITWYTGKMNSRLNISTDVTIEIYGEPVGEAGPTAELPDYMITAVVGVEEGGEAKTVRVHIVDALFDYPTGYSDGRYNNCVRNGYTHTDIDLVPGETVQIQQQITFRAESEANPDNIRIAAFVEDEYTTDRWDVLQSEMVAWPLEAPANCPEDTNGDDEVNIDDLFDVLGHWGETDVPQDVNEDGAVDIDDVFAVLGAWGPCP